MKKKISLDKKIDNLAKTVEDLAEATAKGFENTATKQDIKDMKKDFENLENRIDDSLEDFTQTIRGDYDELSSRVKRLEITVFKR